MSQLHLARRRAVDPGGDDVLSSAVRQVPEVLADLGTSEGRGLSAAAAQERIGRYGPNSVATHRTRATAVLWHQLRSPLLGLLLTAAAASYVLGERSDAVIIAVILSVSVGLGFVNEYRAGKAADALHSQINHQAVVTRDGTRQSVPVAELVPGDIVDVTLGEIVPADLRLLRTTGLECDESMMTGEAEPVRKGTDPVASGTALADLTSCALMGTVVRAGSGRGAVVSTGVRAQFGAIALGLSTQQVDTAFQAGLQRFSMLLVYVAGTLTSLIFVVNLLLDRPVLDSLLFSLAIAVGITPPAAAGRGVHEPGGGIPPDAAPARAGQAARVHRGPGRRRDAVHRQDRDAHDRSDHLCPRGAGRNAFRRGADVGPALHRPGLAQPQRAGADGRWECPGPVHGRLPRRPAPRDGTAGVHPGRSAPVRPRPADGVRRRRTQPT